MMTYGEFNEKVNSLANAIISPSCWHISGSP